jgi:hypothetical protein
MSMEIAIEYLGYLSASTVCFYDARLVLAQSLLLIVYFPIILILFRNPEVFRGYYPCKSQKVNCKN